MQNSYKVSQQLAIKRQNATPRHSLCNSQYRFPSRQRSSACTASGEKMPFLVMLPMFVLLLLIQGMSAQGVYFVVPDNSSDCPGEQCLSLDEYALQSVIYFRSGATFVFLPGNHSMRNTVELENAFNITLRGAVEDTSKIICFEAITFVYRYITNLNIEGLTFILNSGNPERTFFAALIVIGSREVTFSRLALIGSGDPSMVLARGLYAGLSDIHIHQCLFKGNTGDDGGAVLSQDSNITITDSIFIGNMATSSGGAVYAQGSSITLISNASDAYIFSIMQREGISSICQITDGIDILGSIANRSDWAECSLLFLNNVAQHQNGGAMFMIDSRTTMEGIGIKFTQNTAREGGAIYAWDTNVNSTCTFLYFTWNRANSGGAYYGIRRLLSLGGEDESTSHRFINNSAVHIGGALHYESGGLQISGDTVFARNTITQQGGAINIQHSNFSLSGWATFSENRAIQGGAVSILNTSTVFGGDLVEFVENSAQTGGGGAIVVTGSVVTMIVSYTHFIGNQAGGIGGAYAGVQGVLQLGKTEDHHYYFINNSATREGGAIYCQYGGLTIGGNSLFEGNSVQMQGGALSIASGNLSVLGRAVFIKNRAFIGGAMTIVNSSAVFHGPVIKFANNSARSLGGAIASNMSRLVAGGAGQEVSFIGNSARSGGALAGQNDTGFRITSALFINNSATIIREDGIVCGDAMHFYLHEGRYHDVTILGNSGTAMCFVTSKVAFYGTTVIRNNQGVHSGGMRLEMSSTSFMGHTIFKNNHGTSNGGAISGLYGTSVSISGTCLFTQNSAAADGGAVHISDSHMTMEGRVNFTSNSAVNGGVMYFRSGATLTLEYNTVLRFSFNHASMSGGAIYHRDSATLAQCKFEHRGNLVELPLCFLRLNGLTLNDVPYSILSYHNTAGAGGNFLFGGLIDK